MTDAATGLQTILGTAEETTYGTAVTCDKFYELLSEGIKRDQKKLPRNGLRGGTRNVRRSGPVSARSAAGPLVLEVAKNGFGRWFKHLLGGTPTIAQQGGSAAWLQTHQMGSLQGKSLTIQKQLRDQGQNLIGAFTEHGCKILSGEFSITVDQILQLALAIDAQDEETTTAAATASYPANLDVFRFSEGAITVGGVAVANVKTANVKVTNELNTDRRYLGNLGLKAEPVDNDFPKIDGMVTAEFLDLPTLYNRFTADSAVALVLTFTGSIIASTFAQMLKITVPEIHFLGETPTVPNAQVLEVSVPFEGNYDGTNPGIKVEYMSTDTAI